MFSNKRFLTFLLIAIFFSLGVAGVVYANHSWGNYHWARSANPFTLKLGDNVSSFWDGYLSTASTDWSASSVLDTTIVAGGTTPRKCKPVAGQAEVCSEKYGFNGWLGIARIWVSGDHITQGVVKMNDSYFNTSTYNTPAWRRLVMCQEVGHIFGLDHQDENFSNANLGTCMDYTNDPDGPLSNEHPNAHDYAELEAIYAHLDGVTTVGQALPRGNGARDLVEPGEWGKIVRKSSDGRPSLYVYDLPDGHRVFTFVVWAK